MYLNTDETRGRSFQFRLNKERHNAESSLSCPQNQKAQARETGTVSHAERTVNIDYFTAKSGADTAEMPASKREFNAMVTPLYRPVGALVAPGPQRGIW